MKVVYSEEAKATIFSISDFIDNINTEDAGERWVHKLYLWVESYARPNTQYALCNNESLASLGLSCVSFNDWVIAFAINGDSFVVHKILRGGFLI